MHFTYAWMRSRPLLSTPPNSVRNKTGEMKNSPERKTRHRELLPFDKHCVTVWSALDGQSHLLAQLWHNPPRRAAPVTRSPVVGSTGGTCKGGHQIPSPNCRPSARARTHYDLINWKQQQVQVPQSVGGVGKTGNTYRACRALHYCTHGSK